MFCALYVCYGNDVDTLNTITPICSYPYSIVRVLVTFYQLYKWCHNTFSFKQCHETTTHHLHISYCYFLRAVLFLPLYPRFSHSSRLTLCSCQHMSVLRCVNIMIGLSSEWFQTISFHLQFFIAVFQRLLHETCLQEKKEN